MTETQNEYSTGKAIVILIVVAIVTAVAITLAQRLFLGSTNIAVTGGVVGGITGAVGFSLMRKNSG